MPPENSYLIENMTLELRLWRKISTFLKLLLCRYKLVVGYVHLYYVAHGVEQAVVVFAPVILN